MLNKRGDSRFLLVGRKNYNEKHRSLHTYFYVMVNSSNSTGQDVCSHGQGGTAETHWCVSMHHMDLPFLSAKDDRILQLHMGQPNILNGKVCEGLQFNLVWEPIVSENNWQRKSQSKMNSLKNEDQHFIVNRKTRGLIRILYRHINMKICW